MQRPTSLTVFGILNIVFGVLGICGTIMAAAMFAIPQQAAAQNPMLKMMQENEAYRLYTLLATGLGFVATIVLIAAGIGLLKVQRWGRWASIGYAGYSIVASIVASVVNYFVLVVPLMQQAGNAAPGPEQAGLIGGAMGGAVGGCLGIIYPVVLLIFMFRPNVVAACKAEQATELEV